GVGSAPRMSFGTASFVLNDAMTQLSFTATVTGIDLDGTQTPGIANDNLTAAHIHAGPTAVPGMTAGVVFGFQGTPFHDTIGGPTITRLPSGAGHTVSTTWDRTEGGGGFATQLPFILTGRAYINSHPTQSPGGETRGQIIQPTAPAVPEPSAVILLGLG